MVVCIAGHQCKSAKTTTAVNLAYAAAMATRDGDPSTLLVDWDISEDATGYFRSSLRLPGIPAEGETASPPWQAGNWPLGDTGLLPPILATCHPHLSFWPLGGWLRATAVGDLLEEPRISHFRAEFQQTAGRFGMVLVDCSHSAGGLTELAFSVADQILLTVPSDPYFAEFIPPMVQLVRNQMQKGHPLDFAGVLVTMRQQLSDGRDDPANAIRDFFGDIVFETMIPTDPQIVAAGAAQRPVVLHAPRSRGTRAYVELCMEVLKR